MKKNGLRKHDRRMFVKIILTISPLIYVALVWKGFNHVDPALTDKNNHSATVSQIREQIRYLALGDSYTIGHNVEPGRRWPVQLADSLRKSGIGMAGVDIIAKTGWTTGELAEAIASENPQGPYHLVSLLIGVNNQYRDPDTATYRTEFRRLLQKAINLAGDRPEKVIVVSIPDYGVTPFARNKDPGRIAEEIDAFNAINYNETLIAGARYVDVTPISKLAAEDPELLANDGLHPSGKMYSEWVNRVFPVALQIIQNQKKNEE